MKTFKQLRTQILEATSGKYKGHKWKAVKAGSTYALYVDDEKIDIYKSEKDAEKAAKEYVDFGLNEAKSISINTNDIVVKKLNKAKVMKLKPELVGQVANIKFYEHPTKGDESPLIADTGKDFGISAFWEVPSLDELR